MYRRGHNRLDKKWLTDRKQRFVVDLKVSNWKSVLSGVPKGTVLGPLINLIYINDFEDNITSNILKLADDKQFLERLTMMVMNNVYKTISTN